jgi:hypothetical protein
MGSWKNLEDILKLRAGDLHLGSKEETLLAVIRELTAEVIEMNARHDSEIQVIKDRVKKEIVSLKKRVEELQQRVKYSTLNNNLPDDLPF